MYVYTASALLMSAMLGLEVELITGFMPGGGSGLSPPAPVPALENLSSAGFVSLIFFLSAGVKRDKAAKFSRNLRSQFQEGCPCTWTGARSHDANRCRFQSDDNPPPPRYRDYIIMFTESSVASQWVTSCRKVTPTCCYSEDDTTSASVLLVLILFISKTASHGKLFRVTK